MLHFLKIFKSASNLLCYFFYIFGFHKHFSLNIFILKLYVCFLKSKFYHNKSQNK